MNIYVIPQQISTGVLKSQIIERAEAFKRIFNVEYLLVSSSNCLSKVGINILHFNSYFKILKYISFKDVIYTRSVKDYLFYFPFRIFGMRIVYDFRGFASYESYYRNKSFFRFAILFLLEFFCYFTASNVCTVSNRFKFILVKKFIFKRRIQVIPCLISEDIITNNFILESKNKFVYLGSANKWQKVDRVIQIFDSINNNDFSLDIITNDIDNVEEFIKDSKKKIEVFSLNNQPVNYVLAKYDFGFLLRDDLMLNKVSSPIKFLEYCAAGVIPIISDNVGDYSEIVRTHKLGIVFKSVDQLVDTISDLDIERYKKNCINFANNYTWDNYLRNNLSHMPYI